MLLLARARDQVRGQLAGGGDHAREAQRAAELHGLERLCQGGEQVAEDGGRRVGAELGYLVWARVTVRVRVRR